MKSICFWPILFIAVLIANPVHATVINFDDLTTPYELTGTNYEGLTWGQAPQPWEGDWTVGSDASGNAIPHSSPNFVLNEGRSDAMWFEFPAPVTIFNGAWFSQFRTEFVTKISMGDDQSNGTGWLTLTATPQVSGGQLVKYPEGHYISHFRPLWEISFLCNG